MKTNHFISKITIAHEFVDVFFSVYFCVKLEDSQCSPVVNMGIPCSRIYIHSPAP